MRYDGSVGVCPADICELFADLFESVYNVDTCDSDTEDVSGPSNDCGFSGIRLRMSDLQAAISGLYANKGLGNHGVPPYFVKLCADGSKSPLLHIAKNGSIPSSFLFSRSVNEMMLVIIVVWQYFHALRNCSRSQYMIIFFFFNGQILYFVCSTWVF
jgi:hypothetical protein